MTSERCISMSKTKEAQEAAATGSSADRGAYHFDLAAASPGDAMTPFGWDRMIEGVGGTAAHPKYRL